jgi:hypothetical protein
MVWGVPRENLCSHGGNWVVYEIEGRSVQTLVRRDSRVVLKWPDDVQGHLNLTQTLIQIDGGAFRVKARSCCDDMIFRGSYGPLRPIGVLDERRD